METVPGNIWHFDPKIVKSWRLFPMRESFGLNQLVSIGKDLSTRMQEETQEPFALVLWSFL
jgi:hypothetical protein